MLSSRAGLYYLLSINQIFVVILSFTKSWGYESLSTKEVHEGATLAQ